MNKTKITVIVSLAITAIVSTAAPFAITQLDASRGAMGWFLLLFLAFDPLLLAAIGIASGFQLRKRWWLPLVCALCIPLLYSISMIGFAVGLFAYLPLYMLVGGIPMLITHGVIAWRRKKENSVDA